ncbi:hypothetical protein BTUL_0081g00500 [Botrytis tulipae]|uniref:Uncharacterized protein n=1 Tax=Botrytis tulipae TaxID=87230 RepID=A0A4Z1EUM8_9HELO|nr:hypothetical protein BTUL_0081g00500 [Botrytis tulipae]
MNLLSERNSDVWYGLKGGREVVFGECFVGHRIAKQMEDEQMHDDDIYPMKRSVINISAVSYLDCAAYEGYRREQFPPMNYDRIKIKE